MTVLVALLLGGADFGTVLAANFSWAGAGSTLGPSSSTDFNDTANWRVSGTVPASVPNAATDNVFINFNQTFTSTDANVYAVTIPAGLTLGRVDVTGVATASDSRRRVLISGDSTFDSLRYSFDASQTTTGGVILADGVTLTLNGGSEASRTYTGGNVRWDWAETRQGVRGPGTVDFVGEDVFYSGSGPLGNPDTVVRFSHPDANVTFSDYAGTTTSNLAPSFGGDVEFRSTQTLTGANIIQVRGDLLSGNAQPLDNFSGIIIASTFGAQNSTIAPGTYGGLFWSGTASSSGFDPQLRLAGNVTLDSDVLLTATGVPGAVGSGTGVVLHVYRQRSSGGTARISTDGYDVTTTSAGRVQIGQVYSGSSSSYFNLSGTGSRQSTVTVAGDFWVIGNGVMESDATSKLIVGGDYLVQSVRNTLFNTSLMTLTLDGGRNASNPQQLEVAGADLGIQATLPANNFSLGTLIIGSTASATWVNLVNLFEFAGGGDALYLSSLELRGGSTLALNDLKLYVGGTLVKPGDSYGDGFIVAVPEPATLLLLLGGLGWLVSTRRLLLSRRHGSPQSSPSAAAL